MDYSVKTQRWLRASVGTLALAAIVFHATAVVVREGEAVLVTRFGRPLRIASETGLHWKLPWPIDQASLLDMRRRVYETGHTEMLTRDKKNIIVRTFVVWRIGDPPVHALPDRVDHAAQRCAQPADLRRSSPTSHLSSLLCRREKGSESVRRMRDVCGVTSLPSASSERVNR